MGNPRPQALDLPGPSRRVICDPIRPPVPPLLPERESDPGPVEPPATPREKPAPAAPQRIPEQEPVPA